MSQLSGILLFGVCIVLILCPGCISPVENRNVPVTSPVPPAPGTQLSVSPSYAAVDPATIPPIENSTPWIHVDPVALNHTEGEPFTLTGTTNLKSGERVFLDIFPPRWVRNCGGGTEEIAVVSPGNGTMNIWSLSDVNLTKTLPPCPYIIVISDVNNTVPGEEVYFNIVGKTEG